MNSIACLLRISIVITDFMSARVNLMKTVNGCKDVSIMSPQDELRGQVYSVIVYCNFLDLLSTSMQSKHIYKQIVNLADGLQLYQ